DTRAPQPAQHQPQKAKRPTDSVGRPSRKIEVREYNFATDADGATVLPPSSLQPLGDRLYKAVVSKQGQLRSELGPLAQAALKEKHFNLVEVGTGRVGLHPDTPLTGRKHNPAMEDAHLAQQIRAHEFITNADGATILPPQTLKPLGARLVSALVDNKGGLLSALGPEAQDALREKHFNLVEVGSGRVGLHPNTPRAGGSRQEPMTDHQLAEAVRNHNFATNDMGVPILPARTTPLGVRLGNAVVNGKGEVLSALKHEAQTALAEKKFTLVTSTDGRRVGLHPSTPRTGGTHQPQARGPLVPAAAGPAPGGSRQPTGQTDVESVVRRGAGAPSPVPGVAQAASSVVPGSADMAAASTVQASSSAAVQQHGFLGAGRRNILG
ncbi:hypothetical protein ACH4C6_34925, partial [Streptomyces sp. NPDC017943]